MYYTPSLDEFCIGFEYEEHTHSYIENLKEKPIPRYTLRKITTPEELTNALDKMTRDLIPKIRIQTLTSEAICSLGFTCVSVTKVVRYKKEVNIKPFIYLSARISEILIQHDPPTGWLKLSANFAGDYDTLFEGKIRNKSELIRLLNQLELIESNS